MSEGPVNSEASTKEVLDAGKWLLDELGKIELHPDTVDLLYERFVGGLELDGEDAWNTKDGVRPMAGAVRRLEKVKEKAKLGFWGNVG